jgi:hypothetical protein
MCPVRLFAAFEALNFAVRESAVSAVRSTVTAAGTVVPVEFIEADTP